MEHIPFIYGRYYSALIVIGFLLLLESIVLLIACLFHFISVHTSIYLCLDIKYIRFYLLIYPQRLISNFYGKNQRGWTYFRPEEGTVVVVADFHPAMDYSDMNPNCGGSYNFILLRALSPGAKRQALLPLIHWAAKESHRRSDLHQIHPIISSCKCEEDPWLSDLLSEEPHETDAP